MASLAVHVANEDYLWNLVVYPPESARIGNREDNSIEQITEHAKDKIQSSQHDGVCKARVTRRISTP